MQHLNFRKGICLSHRFLGLAICFSLVGAAVAQPDNQPPMPPKGMKPGGGRPGTEHKPVHVAGAYTLKSGEQQTLSGKAYQSDKTDTSAIFVTQKSILKLSKSQLVTSGNTSSNDNSSFYGQNAGLLVNEEGQATLELVTIETTGSGANGLFAYGSGSKAVMTGGSVKATGDGGHAIMCSGKGSIEARDVYMETHGIHGAPIATDRGGGTILVNGGKVVCYGTSSPGIYSTGKITVNNADIAAIGSEAVVIEGSNSVELNNTKMIGKEKCGAMIYQSFSGDAEGRKGVFIMNQGSLTAEKGPMFFVTNTNAEIYLTNVKLESLSGIMINAAATGRWGHKGSNGGNAKLFAKQQVLIGDFTSDSISTIAITLQQKSKLTGKIDHGSIAIDKESEWVLTGNSELAVFSSDAITANQISNVTGNGFTITYNASLPENKALNGQMYVLVKGGTLRPK